MRRTKDRLASLKLLKKASAPDPEEIKAQQNKIRASFLKLLEGCAEPSDFDTVAMHVNVCKIRALEISEALADVLTAAQVANSKVRERYVQWGKLQVTAAEREAVADALEACDAIVEASTPLQMEVAHKRMIQGLLKSVKKT